MSDAPAPARHSTATRQAFAEDFAAAVSMIKALNAREPHALDALKAARARAQLLQPSATRAAAPAAPAARIDLNGRETTQQLSFQPYNIPAAFKSTTKHRKLKDDYTEFVEAVFMDRNLFGKSK